MKATKILNFVLVLLILSSCNKANDESSGIGDAIIISKKSGTDVVYGYALYAYTFSSFKSVEATSSLETGKTYTLKINQGFKTNFYYEMPGEEFTTVKPVAATFNFSAVFENGATDEFQDELSDKTLPVPVIEKAEYNSTDKAMGVTWATVTSADSYAINIYDGSTLVFGSPELINTLKYYAINSSTSGWISGYKPTAGKIYTVRLNAYLYEPSGNSYNLQAVSMAEKSMTWSE